MHRSRFAAILLPAALVLSLTALTVCTYAPAIGNGFAPIDDGTYVLMNNHVVEGLSWPNFAWAFRPNPKFIWHPLVWLSLMANSTLLGYSPAAYHAVNVALHASCVVLCFLLLNVATRQPWPSALTAALLAVHPTHVESVAWIAERKDVLSLFFLLLAVAAYGFYLRRPSPARYLILAAVFALALMAKPNTVMLPALFLALDIWPLGRATPAVLLNRQTAWPALRPLVVEKLPLLPLAAVAYWMNTGFHSLITKVSPENAIPLTLRLKNALVSVWDYLWALVWPTKLAMFYPFPETVPWWQATLALAGLAAALVAAFLSSRNRGWLLAGPAWFLLALLPVLGLYQHGFLPARADRYTYIPFLGLYALLSFETWSLCSRRRLGRAVWSTAALVALGLLVSRTSAQISLWGDHIALYSHAEQVAPGNWPAAGFLGQNLFARKRYQEAADAYRRALDYKPTYIAARNGLAKSLDALNDTPQALGLLRETTRMHPEHFEAYYHLGMFLLKHRMIAEAEKNLSQALNLAPDRAEIHQGLAQLHLHSGKYEDATREYLAALEIDSDAAGAHLGLGLVLKETGHCSDALEEFRLEGPRSLQDPTLYSAIGHCLIQLGRLEEAVPAMARAAQLQPDSAQAWNNFGVLLARLGRLEQARQALNKALEVDPGFERARASLEKVEREMAQPPSSPGK